MRRRATENIMIVREVAQKIVIKAGEVQRVLEVLMNIDPRRNQATNRTKSPANTRKIFRLNIVPEIVIILQMSLTVTTKSTRRKPSGARSSDPGPNFKKLP